MSTKAWPLLILKFYFQNALVNMSLSSIATAFLLRRELSGRQIRKTAEVQGT